MLGFPRILCCSNIPKSTSSDYFFDPRVITIGPTRFQPDKIQNTVEDHEFQKMREEMITVGGSNLKTAKILYFSMVVFAIICLIWWIVRIVLTAGFNRHFSTTAVVISLVLMIVIIGLLNRGWVYFMKRGAKDIQEMFERLNRATYSRRGVNWMTCQTLVYIRIKIFVPQQFKPEVIIKT